MASGDEIGVTEPVIMEVVVGARSGGRERDLRRFLARFSLLPFDPLLDFDGAAAIYRLCRQRGVTPRGLIDCMIAAVARRNGAAILAQDADMNRVAYVIGLSMEDGSAPMV